MFIILVKSENSHYSLLLPMNSEKIPFQYQVPVGYIYHNVLNKCINELHPYSLISEMRLNLKTGLLKSFLFCQISIAKLLAIIRYSRSNEYKNLLLTLSDILKKNGYDTSSYNFLQKYLVTMMIRKGIYRKKEVLLMDEPISSCYIFSQQPIEISQEKVKFRIDRKSVV